MKITETITQGSVPTDQGAPVRERQNWFRQVRNEDTLGGNRKLTSYQRIKAEFAQSTAAFPPADPTDRSEHRGLRLQRAGADRSGRERDRRARADSGGAAARLVRGANYLYRSSERDAAQSFHDCRQSVERDLGLGRTAPCRAVGGAVGPGVGFQSRSGRQRDGRG